MSSAPQDQAVFGLGILWIGLACALVCNLRATLPAMPLRAAIAYDARLVLLMAFTVPLLLAMQFILWSPYPPIVSILFLEWLICLIITILLRIAARLWKQWEAARRRRLRRRLPSIATAAFRSGSRLVHKIFTPKC